MNVSNVSNLGNLYLQNLISDDQDSQQVNGPGAQRDTIDISAEARLANTVQVSAKKLDDLSDIRPEKVEAARQALESGALFSEQAVREAAEAMVREM